VCVPFSIVGFLLAFELKVSLSLKCLSLFLSHRDELQNKTLLCTSAWWPMLNRVRAGSSKYISRRASKNFHSLLNTLEAALKLPVGFRDLLKDRQSVTPYVFKLKSQTLNPSLKLPVIWSNASSSRIAHCFLCRHSIDIQKVRFPRNNHFSLTPQTCYLSLDKSLLYPNADTRGFFSPLRQSKTSSVYFCYPHLAESSVHDSTE
jgi:hypothetical protein